MSKLLRESHPLKLRADGGEARAFARGELAIYADEDSAARTVWPVRGSAILPVRVRRGVRGLVLVGRVPARGAA